MYVALYCLSTKKSDVEREYCDLGTIVEFVNFHWSLLSNKSKNEVEDWVMQCSKTLINNQRLFESGTHKIKKAGYWKLRVKNSPWEFSLENGKENGFVKKKRGRPRKYPLAIFPKCDGSSVSKKRRECKKAKRVSHTSLRNSFFEVIEQEYLKYYPQDNPTKRFACRKKINERSEKSSTPFNYHQGN